MAFIRKGNLSHTQQSRLRASDRQREILREENMKRLSQEKLLEANMDSEERVENKRFLRRLQEEERERNMEEALINEKEARVLIEQQRDQEERLAKELEMMKMEKIRDEKFRQQIRENSVELRELEAKLKAGYMNQERAAQLAEKRVLEIDEQNRQAEIAKTMREQHDHAVEAETAKEKQKWAESIRYQEELEKQLIEQEKQKHKAYEEFLKEKLMIDEIVRKIYEEDQRELEKRFEKQRATQRYIEEFKKKREEWKNYEKDLMEEENKRILEFAKEQQNREEDRMEKRKQAEEAMTKVQQRLAKQIASEQAEKEEMERIRMELYMEEEEEKERQREKMEIENKFRQRVDLQETRRQQLHYKELKKKAEMEEEEEFRKQSTADNSVRRVFASLDNGSLVVISRREDRQNSTISCSFQFRSDANEKLRQEATVFSAMTTVEIDDGSNRQSPACCLLFVNKGRELWVGCGNNVAVVDVNTLEVSQKFCAYNSPRSNVRAMVTDGPTVFTINRQSPSVLQWHVETRQLLYKFNCNRENPRNLIIAQKIPTKHEGSSKTMDPNDDDSFFLPETNVGNESGEDSSLPPHTTLPEKSDPVSAQMLPVCTQILPVVRDTAILKQPSLMRTLKQRGSRSSSRKKKKGGNETDQEPDQEPITLSRADRSNVITNRRKRITSVLVVDGILWLGRETGDIVVVDISCMENVREYGLVLAVLSLGNEPGHSKKEVHGMAKVGGDKVVTCSKLLRERNYTKNRSQTSPGSNNRGSFVTSTSPYWSFLRSASSETLDDEEPPKEKFQVSIWGRWKAQDFKEFYKYHEDLENAYS